MAKTYTIIYRTGGLENFRWNRTLERFSDYDKALAFARSIDKQGYKTLIHDSAMLDSIGLPDTY